MRRFHQHCSVWLSRLGYDQEPADAIAWSVVEHASDAARLRQQPYCILRPGSDTPPVFLSGISSDRLRDPSGVLIVLDVAAMRADLDVPCP